MTGTISLIIALGILAAEIFGIMVCGVVSAVKTVIEDAKEAKRTKSKTKEN